MPMLALLVAALVQAPDDDSLERRVERFVAGDDMQAAAIRSAGPGALSLLRPHRANLKVNDLIREIRQISASPEDRKMARLLAALKSKLETEKAPLVEAVDQALGKGIPWTFDPLEFESIAAREVARPREGSGVDVLEDLCSQAKVDFAFRYGIVLIAAPERLWPPPPLRSRPLTADETKRATSLIAKLGAESPDERDRAAAELRKLGSPILPLLEAGAADKDTEVSGRCRGLASELRPPPPTIFGSPAVERHKLSRADEEVLANLRVRTTTYKVRGLVMRNSLILLVSQFEGELLPAKYPEKALDFSFDNIPSAAVLAIMTQCAGLDYTIEGGKVIVGPREEIQRHMPAEKR